MRPGSTSGKEQRHEAAPLFSKMVGWPPCLPLPRTYLLGRCRRFRRSLIGGFEHLFKKALEVIQSGCRNNDRVPSPVHVFSDPQKPSSRVLLQCKNKGLPFDLNLVIFDRFFDHIRLWSRVLMGSMPERRGTFIRYHTVAFCAFTFLLQTLRIRSLSTPEFAHAGRIWQRNLLG